MILSCVAGYVRCLTYAFIKERNAATFLPGYIHAALSHTGDKGVLVVRYQRYFVWKYAASLGNGELPGVYSGVGFLGGE